LFGFLDRDLAIVNAVPGCAFDLTTLDRMEIVAKMA